MNCTGARIVLETLIELGVDTVFGYPGGSILNIYDELYRQKNRIRHILTAHEQGAAHAADGYARASGKTGVVFATSGPGATNLVTGIATAYMDSSPIVAITCNVSSPLLGKDSFQEVDICGITMPITKHNYIVRDVSRLSDTIKEAFMIASSGRRGPVLIDIPKEITALTADWNEGAPFKPVSASAADRRIKNPKPEEIALAARFINEAKRPLIYAGGGVLAADACEELKLLAELINAPVCVSLMGKTAFPAKHELCTGMIGMHGTKASNEAASRCDLLIAVGARFSDRVISVPDSFARGAQVLHIDVDPAEINKNIRCQDSLTGDVKHILQEIYPMLTRRSPSAWNEQILDWKNQLPSSYEFGERLHPRRIMEYIRESLGEDTIITTEVGQHQMWAAQFYPFSKPRAFITSGGLGTMGFGVGAAIGAQTAFPDRFVVHIAGDGSFRMNCNELATIQNYNLPIIIIVMNNGTLGMVRQWQTLFYDRRHSETTLDRGPDFVKLAEAYNIRGFRACTNDEFVNVFNAAAAERKPAVIDCRIDIDEMVLPMVAPGKPIDEIVMEIN